LNKPQPLSEVGVILQRLQPGGKAVPLDYPDNIGKRTKLGGEPDWEQEDETPVCPECGEFLTFVAQIDSIDYSGWGKADERYMFGDVGMIYVFYCLACNETSSVVQGY